jgi:serine/threonine protein kinase
MSPEQVRSAKSVDVRTDVWSLGIVLYELLTGCQPFAGDSVTAVEAAITADTPHPLRALRPDVPLELERVVMKALEKDREHRYPDASALGAALAPFAGAENRPPVSPALPPAPSRPKPKSHVRVSDRRPFWAIAAVLTLVCGLILVALYRDMTESTAVHSSGFAVLAASTMQPAPPIESAEATIIEEPSPRAAEPRAAPAPATKRPVVTNPARKESVPTRKNKVDLPDDPG